MRRSSFARFVLPAVASLTFGCSSGETTPPPVDAGPSTITWPAMGSTSATSGKGSFRFGASTAATQIEDKNPTTDWFVWTAPPPQGLGKGTFVGDASKGYSLSIADIDLLAEMHLDSYRFSMEWARIEPVRDQIDEAALDHYSKLLDALVARHIRPMVTIHHFSNPVWIDDPRDHGCTGGPGDKNLCGLDNAVGGPLVVKELADHARLLAKRFGDRVDEWCTVNEPVNYLLASYGVGSSPPGKSAIVDDKVKERLGLAMKNYIAAHAAMYKAIKEADTIDADGDGVAASVGFTHGAQEWVPARAGKISENKADVAARDRLLWVYEYLFVEALRQGSFDSDLDGNLEEPHPEWKGTLDWLGVQYYFRAGVTANTPLIPVLNLTPCYDVFDFGACVAPIDPTFRVPAMNYEYHPEGLYTVLADFGKRWPDLPMTVTEAGIATTVGPRRAEAIVRALESIDKARQEGVDVRGYYHWSTYDNFEWAQGFKPQFGLYSVDFKTFERTATEGATVLGQIAGAHSLTAEMRSKYGGSGPMTEETAK
jgi:beta-glucosidase/6-phospho-beta-glucosidase/beta-galactosidase